MSMQAPLGALLHFRRPTAPSPPRPRLVLVAESEYEDHACDHCGRPFTLRTDQPFTEFCGPPCAAGYARADLRRDLRGAR